MDSITNMSGSESGAATLSVGWAQRALATDADGLLLVSGNGHIHYANDVARQWLALSAPASAMESVTLAACVSEDAREALSRALASALENDAQRVIAGLAGHGARHFEIRLSLAPAEPGAVPADDSLLLVARLRPMSSLPEVTADGVDRVYQQARQRVNDALREGTSTAGMAYAAAEILGTTLKVSRAGYGTIDPVVETIVIERDWNAPGIQTLAGTLHFRDYGSYIDDLKRGETVVFADAYKDPRTASTADALKAISAVSVVNMPVSEEGGMVALLYLNHELAREWTEAELALIREVAERTRSAIQRRRAEQDLTILAASLERQVKLRTGERDRMWRLSGDVMMVVDYDNDILAVNPAWTRVLGWKESDSIGRSFRELVHPDDSGATDAIRDELIAGKELKRFENRYRHRDGSYRWISWSAVPGDGVLQAVGRDITVEKQNAEALARAQDQLRQAQKMEAIGNLTGGIAHDFNNLLQVIGGNLQLLLSDVRNQPTAERRVNSAMEGVKRGSKLSAQLLAFGRRQPLAPRAVNLGRLIRGMDELLRHTLGEGIEVETVVAGGLWNTLVDAVNVENALLNLAINARDAMDGRGRLTIEAGNASLDQRYCENHAEVTPGQYVMLAVTDTGEGMPTEVIERAFDPFFTTKPQGRGTGLGLSMVYGFVKQSGGHVKIYSEAGEGTTIRLYLPRSTEAEAAPAPLDNTPLCRGSETVLVAEDDEHVREIVVAMLGELGYRVLEARDAQSALGIIESGAAVDLLFTDVVMPGSLKSPELARRARALLPHLAVLFTSGYTENAIVHGGKLDAGVELLTKPYTRDALAKRLRQVLRAQAAQNDGHATAAVAATPAVAMHDSKPTAAPQPGDGALCILLCEDEWLIRASMAEMLTARGHQVVEAGDATAALAAFGQHRVDLLLTDVGLPGQSGVDLARRLREQVPDLPVLFATGRGALSDIPNDGRTGYVAKPYGVNELIQAINRVRNAPAVG